MGHISSKCSKSDLKPSKQMEDKCTETSLETTEVPDVRSPSCDINRTPIIVEKGRLSDDSRDQYSVPLRTKLLKSLKLDPRSPSAGIYRTPILVEDSGSAEKSCQFDSPISIYSNNFNDSIPQDITTPSEPSVNVSKFEDSTNMEALDTTLEPEEIVAEERRCKNIKISDKPNTYEARRLLDEILKFEEENFVEKVPLKREKKAEIKIIDKKPENKQKIRAPLSNITATTNSPKQINTGGKNFSKNKIFADSGSENSNSPSVKYSVQWDQNNTVVI